MKKKRQEDVELTSGEELPDREYVPTGFPNLDALLGGGIPKGHITVIGGRYGQGKSTLAYSIARSIQQDNLLVMIVDAGRGLSKKRRLREGLVPAGLVRPRTETFEDFTDRLSYVVDLARERFINTSRPLGGIIVDPIDSFATRDTEMTEGQRRNRIETMLHQLRPQLEEVHLPFIAVCRTMKDESILFGNPFRPFAWLESLLHAASVHLEVSVAQYIRGEDQSVIGRSLRIRVLKNQEGQPPGECVVSHSYLSPVQTPPQTH